MADASMVDVMRYFGYTKVVQGKTVPDVSAFRADWATLDELDKSQLKEGIGNGSLTY